MSDIQDRYLADTPGRLPRQHRANGALTGHGERLILVQECNISPEPVNNSGLSILKNEDRTANPGARIFLPRCESERTVPVKHS